MNGVVFQISDAMIANMECQWSPNQLVSESIHGSHENQAFTKPLFSENANCHANADTTVMIP